MKKLILSLLVVMFCSIASIAFAFELDRTQWNHFITANNIEAYYNKSEVKNDGNKLVVWFCYHYNENDNYRLMCKEFVRGEQTSTILKTIDYYGDGTYRRGSGVTIQNVTIGPGEKAVIESLW